MSEHAEGTLGRTLLDFHIVPPTTSPGPPTTLTQVSLKPTTKWRWQDSLVRACPEALTTLQAQLAQQVNLEYPINYQAFCHENRQCEDDMLVTTEAQVQTHLQTRLVFVTNRVFRDQVPPIHVFASLPTSLLAGQRARTSSWPWMGLGAGSWRSRL
jgi:hypothetical protein